MFPKWFPIAPQFLPRAYPLCPTFIYLFILRVSIYVSGFFWYMDQSKTAPFHPKGAPKNHFWTLWTLSLQEKGLLHLLSMCKRPLTRCLSHTYIHTYIRCEWPSEMLDFSKCPFASDDSLPRVFGLHCRNM